MSETTKLVLMAVAVLVGVPVGFILAASIDRWWTRRRRFR